MIVCRGWTYEDIFAIESLERECFTDPWSFRMFADAFSSPYFVGVLAEEDGRVVGYACGTSLFENAELDNLAVAEDMRRAGLGKCLLSAIEKEFSARGAEISLLEVRVSNAPAMRLYLRSGYVGISTRARYYPDGEDAVIMQKKL